MRFEFTDGRRHRRVTRGLRRHMAGLGLDPGQGAAADLAARLYGYGSRRELALCAGTGTPSAWDDEAGPAVSAERRARQGLALAEGGIPQAEIGRILDDLRPTGRRRKPAPARKSAWHSLVEGATALRREPVASPGALASFDRMMARYLDEGWDCLHVEEGDQVEMCLSRVMPYEAHGEVHPAGEMAGLFEHVCRMAGVNPLGACCTDTRFTYRHGGRDVVVGCSTSSLSRPRRNVRLHNFLPDDDNTLDESLVRGLHDWVSATDGGLHLILDDKGNGGEYLWGMFMEHLRRAGKETLSYDDTRAAAPGAKGVMFTLPVRNPSDYAMAFALVRAGTPVVTNARTGSAERWIAEMLGYGYLPEDIASTVRTIVVPSRPHSFDEDGHVNRWEAMRIGAA